MNKALIFFIVLLTAFNAKAQDIQKIADSLIRTNKIPELGFAVISVDSILELQTVGYHRVDLKSEQTKAKLTDYFHLGSNTKAVTGFVAAKLIEENKIKWTTKFFDLFPEWKKNSNPLYFKITLADLLSHKARIQPYTSGLEFQQLPLFKGNKSDRRKKFAKYLLKQNPVISNKIVYNYSNAGYSIASLMLEKVSGKSWEQLTKNIMSKLVNVDIQFGWPNKFNTNEPYGHWIENDTLKALSPKIEYNLSLIEPAGDISMKLEDYAKFIQLNLKGLTGKGNILKVSTYLFLHYGLNDYAIGWRNVNKKNNQFSEHSGSAGTFFSYTLINKTKKIAYIVVANSATVETQEGIFNLLDKMKDKYGW